MGENGSCLFCKILRQTEGDRRWHDQVLYERDGFSVLPGLGAQREGYLLIVPHAHVFSSAELSTHERERLEDVKEEVAHVLNQAYGPCVFFEHGACGHKRRAGGCIDHVHLHALPTEAPIVQVADNARHFHRIRGQDELARWVSRPYVSIQDQTGSLFVADGQDLPGQFMRRMVGQAIGSPDDWDFEAFPQHERMRATITKLEPLFHGIEESDPRYDQRWERSGPQAPLVYVARAVDNRPTEDVREVGVTLRARVREAGFAAVDPVASMFPRIQVAMEENRVVSDFGRVRSDLAWLRRSDALLVDMHIEDWSYVGCVCELVYAHLWDIPTIVIVGSSDIQERIWLRYHASKIVPDIEGAILELQELFAPPPT
jgi:ATP adenylyltransferase